MPPRGIARDELINTHQLQQGVWGDQGAKSKIVKFMYRLVPSRALGSYATASKETYRYEEHTANYCTWNTSNSEKLNTHLFIRSLFNSTNNYQE